MGDGGAMTGLESDVREAYENFASREARGNSSLYEQVCLLIAADADLVRRIAELPGNKRQPNLVLGAAHFLGAPVASAGAFVGWLREHWAAVVDVVMERMTQTNEVGRCATLLPFIGEFAHRVGGPIALVEVGCSAGLTLYPDLYGYRYESQDSADDADGRSDVRLAARSTVDAEQSGVSMRQQGERGSLRVDRAGGERTGGEDPTGRERVDVPPELACRVSGPGAWESVEALAGVPRIAWRGGLDLNPLDVVSDSDGASDNARWLGALVWPGQHERAARLDSAIAAVRSHVTAHPGDAPHVIAGDVVRDLDRLLAQVPDEVPLVLFHSAVLAYVDAPTRAAFEARMTALADRPAGFTWISNEALGVMPGIAARWAAGSQTSTMDTAGRFVLAVDGEPRALTGPHGQTLTFLAVPEGA